MPPSQEHISPDAGLLEDEVIDLEPTRRYDALRDDELPGLEDNTRADRPSAAVAFIQGSSPGGSLTGETQNLRRERLKIVAVALAGIFGLLGLWVYMSDNPGTLAADGSRLSLRVILMGARCLLAVVVAGVLFSEVRLSHRAVRVLESVLFLGITLLLMASQYFVSLDLIHRGPEFGPIVLAFAKDGVIVMIVVMLLYGTLIPNPPAVAARTLLLMLAGTVSVYFGWRMNPDAAGFVEQLGRYEETYSNLLFLGIVTLLAIYCSSILNSLRTELHDARKFGQYRLLKKIGAGGMGEVYMAEHQLLKRPCALKLIKPEAGANPTALARFEREVRSAARLSHPNSIEIFDYGHSEDGTFYYVMEYLPGMSLDALVKETGPLPPGRVVYLIRQACAGLAEAHGLGLVHRDLKPANIFVAQRGGESDVAKVLDFGLVKLTQDPQAPSLTADMTVSGTPAYMAPEQATAKRDLDARADVYALGGVAYFALTGQPPFSGETAFAIMMANARDPVVPPSRIRPDVPSDLEQIILTCLAKKPEDRYPDARALGRALATCQVAGAWDADQADQWWAEFARSDRLEV